MDYLLDTNICVYLINQKPATALSNVLKHVRSKQPGQIAISTITLAELEYGVVRSRYRDRNRIALVKFLVPFALLDFDQAAAAEYGRIRLLLESKREPIGPMDLLLAAQAKSRDLVLVTNNEKEFVRIDGLRIENWAKAST